MKTDSTPIFDRRISVVRCASTANVMCEMSLNEFLNLASFPRPSQYIAAARNYASKRIAKDDEWDVKYKDIKLHRLQGATISGVFDTKRQERNLTAHSGLICIDIDKADNPNVKDWERLKFELGEYSCIAYCALSLSGSGLWCIIPIDNPLSVEIPPITANNDARMHAIKAVKDLHTRQFKALQMSFSEMGLTIDKSCNNLDRLRILSNDPNPYRNDDATIYPHMVPPTIATAPTIKRQSTHQKQPFFGVASMRMNDCSLDEWLTMHGVEHELQSNGEKYNVVCPWEHLHSSHTGVKETCVWEQDGKWCFHCFHSHCADKGWNEFRQAIAPNEGFRSKPLNR